MAAMVQQWTERVDEVTRELDSVEEEITALEEQKSLLAGESEKFAISAKKEKTALQNKLEGLQERAVAVDHSKAQAEKQRTTAKAEEDAAMAEYQRLQATVKQILHDERAMANGEDFEKTLAAESAAWSQEEHQLRAKLQQLEKDVQEQRNVLKASVDADYTARREKDKALKAARMGRTADEGNESLSLQLVFQREGGLFHPQSGNAVAQAGKKTARA